MKELATFAFAATLLGSVAHAAPITIYWSGTVTSISQFGSLDQQLSFADRVEGTITYLPFSDENPDPDRYRSSGVDATVTMSLGADTFSWRGMESRSSGTLEFGSLFDVDNTRDTAPTGSLLSIDIFDNDADADAGGYLASDPASPDGPTAITRNGVEMSAAAASFDLQIDDATTGLFGPTFDFANLNLADFERRKFFNFSMQEDFSAEGGTGSGSNFISGQVRLDYWSTSGPRPDDPSTPPSVPLPAAAWMLMAGIAGLAGFAKRRKERG